MDRLKPFRNVVNNAWKWGLTDLAAKLGVDPQKPQTPEFDLLTRTWDRFNALSDAIRNLDDRTLNILSADPSPEDDPEIPDGI